MKSKGVKMNRYERRGIGGKARKMERLLELLYSFALFF